MKLLPFALFLLVAAPPARTAEPMGRLFYTPDQRAQLDVARNKRARSATPGEKAEDAPPPPPTPEVVTYGGMVRRSDGKTTVWLNNRAVTGKDSSDAKMIGKIRPDGTVTLQSSQTGRQVDLRVGQRADLLSGRVEEGYRQRAPVRPEDRGNSAGSKPAAESAGAAETERKRDDRERQENLDDAVRAMRDAAQARSAPPPPPPQQPGGPVTVFPGPMQAPAPGAPQPGQPYQ